MTNVAVVGEGTRALTARRRARTRALPAFCRSVGPVSGEVIPFPTRAPAAETALEDAPGTPSAGGYPYPDGWMAQDTLCAEYPDRWDPWAIADI